MPPVWNTLDTQTTPWLSSYWKTKTWTAVERITRGIKSCGWNTLLVGLSSRTCWCFNYVNYVTDIRVHKLEGYMQTNRCTTNITFWNLCYKCWLTCNLPLSSVTANIWKAICAPYLISFVESFFRYYSSINNTYLLVVCVVYIMLQTLNKNSLKKLFVVK